ncbi:MAG: tyrosine-type recombinase/integrase [Aliihoeflea sp.]|uniref:tyrosine-type recombinase/integrase n=1 Tax=Aliihoeflea sp. TaxID=2608088 RepID=UPI004033AB19
MKKDTDTAAPAPGPEAETLPVAQGTAAQLAHLQALADKAGEYMRRASSPATLDAYQSDWDHYRDWCFAQDLAPLPADPAVIGLYLTACITPPPGEVQGLAVSTIERRLSGLAWHFRKHGYELDRQDPRVGKVLAGIKHVHWQPPAQKEPVLAADVLAMVDELDRDTLRGLRDRAILLIGFAGGLRRSEIVGLDVGPRQTDEGQGWGEILPDGLLLHVYGKGRKLRQVEIGRGSSDQTCPVVAYEDWLRLGRIAHGPVFRRVSQDGKEVLPDRLRGQHVARLVKATALAAGVRADAAEGDREAMFAGHSLRAGFGSSGIDEKHTQQQFGHATVQMTRRYNRRRERFAVNMTKIAGL